MSRAHRAWLVGIGAAIWVAALGQARADEANRLLLSGNGSRLSQNINGGGGQVAWLHDAGPLHFSLGAEYQSIDVVHWAFGSLAGAYVFGDAAHSSVYAEVHEGSGRNAPAGGAAAPGFHYSIVSAGVSRALASPLTLQLEDRQVDIDTTHGNLPKIGVVVVWNRHFLSTVSYAHSFGGNLQTAITTARFDVYAGTWSLLAGAAFGHAAPAVVNLQPGLTIEQRNDLREGFAGLSHPLGHAQLQLVFDYLKLGDNRRGTATVSFTLPLSAGAP